jgi:hypothetical protein
MCVKQAKYASDECHSGKQSGNPNFSVVADPILPKENGTD